MCESLSEQTVVIENYENVCAYFIFIFLDSPTKVHSVFCLHLQNLPGEEREGKKDRFLHALMLFFLQ